ncbi:YggS family pyridoxal phosphate-dependent enzyme [Candidatus Latescibacterota bacterium]
MSITENVQSVLSDIEDAARRAGRDPSEVKLIAVTKTRSVDEIAEVVEAGVIHLGENRVLEASEKIPETTGNTVWHLIGHLQSNKAKLAAGLFDWVESIDSKKIIDLISTRAVELNKTVDALIQVDISGEESKYGVAPEKAKDLVLYASGKPGIAVCGLMTIGSFGVSSDVTRSEFARMRELFHRFKEDTEIGSLMNELSMGMSGDFKMAIEEGSTMVRVGTSIFGRRDI